MPSIKYRSDSFYPFHFFTIQGIYLFSILKTAFLSFIETKSITLILLKNQYPNHIRGGGKLSHATLKLVKTFLAIINNTDLIKTISLFDTALSHDKYQKFKFKKVYAVKQRHSLMCPPPQYN